MISGVTLLDIKGGMLLCQNINPNSTIYQLWYLGPATFCWNNSKCLNFILLSFLSTSGGTIFLFLFQTGKRRGKFWPMSYQQKRCVSAGPRSINMSSCFLLLTIVPWTLRDGIEKSQMLETPSTCTLSWECIETNNGHVT